jgi:predicted Zn-dependent protease
LERRYPADQRNAEYYGLLGQLKAKNHEPVAAEAALRQAIALDPQFRIAQLMLADFYTDQGRPQEAIAILQPILKADPRNPAVLTSLGDALASIGDVQQAVSSFQTALELAPNLERARVGLAKLGPRMQ